MRVLVSLCHSGPNPSPGYGIAQSIRLGHPNAYIIAKEHDKGATGIHSDVFDEVWLSPAWEMIDQQSHIQDVEDKLNAETLFISGSDTEIRFFFGVQHDHLLLPSSLAIEQTKKPHITIAQKMGLQTPEVCVLASSSQKQIDAFCRNAGWRVWLKGSVYGAKRVSSWTDFLSKVKGMKKDEDLFLQQHVDGYEEGIAFCAYKGVLLDTVYHKKYLVTSEGKTWGGEVSECPAYIVDALRVVVQSLNWSGGGEIEIIREENGNIWVTDWNPRFPAWIYGSALSGKNLPAILVSEALNLSWSTTRLMESKQFIRVVQEIPVKSAFSLTNQVYSRWVSEDTAFKSKNALPSVTSHVEYGTISDTADHMVGISFEEVFGTTRDVSAEINTPCRVLLQSKLQDVLADLVTAQNTISKALGCNVRFAYSVKTDPDSAIIKEVRRSLALADVISTGELLFLRSNGFLNNQIIYNGPVPPQFDYASDPLFCIFADSIESFAQNASNQVAEILGIRICPFGLSSRFGVCIEEYQVYQQLLDTIQKTPVEEIGLSFHFQSSMLGITQWKKHVSNIIFVASQIELLTKKKIVCLDFGGGWTPEDFRMFVQKDVLQLCQTVRAALPFVRDIIFEPGKAISQDVKYTVATVLEKRQYSDKTHIVVDASIADMPQLSIFPHDLYFCDEKNGMLYKAVAGNDAVFGRLCMEHDILASGISIPSSVQAGTKIIISDAGAYDSSMSYVFGMGGGA